MRKFPVFPNNYYHVYNRGVNQGLIYFTKENYYFFLERLRKYFDPAEAKIASYCLMPNHYHLLVYPLIDKFGERIMHPMTVSYTKAVNKSRNRTGSLFEEPYQAKLIEDDKYLLNLSRYIHLNPVSAHLVEDPADTEFSSYREFTGMRNDRIVNPDIVLLQFQKIIDYADFVESDSDPKSGLPNEVLFDALETEFLGETRFLSWKE